MTTATQPVSGAMKHVSLPGEEKENIADKVLSALRYHIGGYELVAAKQDGVR